MSDLSRKFKKAVAGFVVAFGALGAGTGVVKLGEAIKDHQNALDADGRWCIHAVTQKRELCSYEAQYVNALKAQKVEKDFFHGATGLLGGSGMISMGLVGWRRNRRKDGDAPKA